MAMLAWLLLLGWEQPWKGLDPNRYEVLPLHGVISPTSLILLGDTLYLGADLLEARPGFYRLNRHPQKGLVAGLIQNLPQQAIEALHTRGDGHVLVVSGCRFSAYSEDWVNQVITLEPDQFRPVGKRVVEVPNRCSDDTPQCGLTGLHPLNGESMLAVNKGSPARLFLLKRQKDRWLKDRSVFLTLDRKYPVVTEVKRVGETLVFLLRDRWLLAAISLDEALGSTSWKLELTPVFDFGSLKAAFKVAHTQTQYRGMAEGFAFDENGNLLILLNNRGFPFRKSPDGTLDNQPKMLVFPWRP